MSNTIGFGTLGSLWEALTPFARLWRGDTACVYDVTAGSWIYARHEFSSLLLMSCHVALVA